MISFNLKKAERLLTDEECFELWFNFRLAEANGEPEKAVSKCFELMKQKGIYREDDLGGSSYQLYKIIKKKANG